MCRGGCSCCRCWVSRARVLRSRCDAARVPYRRTSGADQFWYGQHNTKSVHHSACGIRLETCISCIASRRGCWAVCWTLEDERPYRPACLGEPFKLVYRSMYTSMSGSVLTSLAFNIAAHRGSCLDCWVNCQQWPTTHLHQTTPSLHILAGPPSDTPPSRYSPTRESQRLYTKRGIIETRRLSSSGRLVRVSARRFSFMSDNLLSRRARFSFQPDSSCNGYLSKTRQGMDGEGRC